MTEHNAVWSESMYYGDDDEIDEDDEDDMDHYWDYSDDY